MTDALGAYLREFGLRGVFDWHARNCCHLVGGWWLRATGVDALAGIAMPRTAAAARRWLRGQRTTLRDLVTEHTGRQPIRPSQARVGDLMGASTKAGVGMALGICTGPALAMLDEHGCVQLTQRSVACIAWPLREGDA